MGSKKVLFTILFIMLLTWLPLNEATGAGCEPCTEVQKATCTDVSIYYEKVPNDPDSDPNWIANMWYTPCGGTNEAPFPYYANGKDNNHCCVKKDSRIRIGPLAQARSFIDKVVTGPEFKAVCTGTIFKKTKEYACCRDANIPNPFTTVNIQYTSQVTGEASITYTPWTACEKRDETSSRVFRTDSPFYEHSFKIIPGTRVQIGPVLTNKNYIDETMSGTEVNIVCDGPLSLNGSGSCCFAGKPNCPPKTCTKLTVKYDPNVAWKASMIYRPCMEAKDVTVPLSEWSQTFNITSGTRVQVGPIATATNYVNEELSGTEVTVRCYGEGLINASCCVLGKPNCPAYNLNSAKTDDKAKVQQKAPSNTKK